MKVATPLLIAPLAVSHYAIGEQIDYLALRTSSPRGSLLNFQTELSAADGASISKLDCELQPSAQTGVVDRVLVADANGYQYRAYVIEWRGTQIVIDDPTAVTDYRPGDSVSFWALRLQLPRPIGAKMQRFTFDRPVPTTAVNQPSDFQTSMTSESAPVQAALISDVDGYRSVAYLVNWHDTPIAVIDAFATTDLAVGDRITFTVGRATAANVKQLTFMLFKFPSPGCATSQPSSDTSASVGAATARAIDCHS